MAAPELNIVEPPGEQQHAILIVASCYSMMASQDQLGLLSLWQCSGYAQCFAHDRPLVHIFTDSWWEIMGYQYGQVSGMIFTF